MQQDDEFSQLFSFVIATNTLTLNPKFEKAITLGQLCPKPGNKIKLELSSNILGKSSVTFDVETPAASAAASADGKNGNTTVFNSFNFQNNVEIEKAVQIRQKEDFQPPKITINSIDKKGILLIAFSDPFRVIKNITQLLDIGHKIDGKKRINLELKVDTVDSQT